ncbi:TonB-dependent receptor [Mucilaginibacter daejeonensis]|nr:TonB-dependent receptor [Mucilaginibacter daejeonensis]UEG51366.1 TonB-dependent receptor [Mucilaginibacter daejeonensis]
MLGYCQALFSCSGIIIGPDGRPLSHVTVSLTQKADQAVKKQIVTDTAGSFTFTGIHSGNYTIQASLLGYRPVLRLLALTTKSERLIMTLEPSPVQLAEVSIKERKKLVTVKGDKIIYDVTTLPGINSDNALEILRKLPGVWVENDQIIRVNGSDAITILLDGKQQTMQLAQVLNLLKSMPASALDKVELTNGGSAKYDAAGGSVLNVVLKKRLTDGYQVTLTNGITLDRYVSHQHSLFGGWVESGFNGNVSLNYTNNSSYFSESGQKLYGPAQLPLTLVNYQRDNRSRVHTPSIYTTLAYDLNRKNALSFSMISNWNNSKGNLNDSGRYHGANNFDLLYNSAAKNRENITSLTLNYRYKADTNGTVLDVSYGYRTGYSDQMQFYNNRLTDVQGNSITPPTIRASIPLQGHQQILSADYEVPYHHAALEAGLKFTNGDVTNKVSYDSLITTSITRRDMGRSDDLRYTERIQAGYLRYILKMAPWSFSAGVRMERTWTESAFLGKKSSVKQTYLNYLPNLAISWHKENISSTLKLTSGLSRPDYKYLNPYVLYINEFKNRTGNPHLQPSKRYTLSVDNSFWDFLSASLGYNRVNGQVFLVNRQVENTLNSLERPENAVNLNDYYSSVSLNYSMLSIRLQGQLNLYGEMYKYEHGSASSDRLDQHKMNKYCSVSFSNDYKISKKFNLETSVFYRSAMELYQTRQAKRWQADVGLDYTMVPSKCFVALKWYDLFNTYRYHNGLFYEGYSASYTNKPNTSRIRLTLVYKLNRGQKVTNTPKETLPDDLNRYK